MGPLGGGIGMSDRAVFWLAVALVAASPRIARAVEIADCKGAVVPSVPGGCAGVTDAGCCDTFGRALWCDGVDLYCVDCAGQFPACGWNPGGYYDCGQAPGSADPTGAHPSACGGCPAACTAGAACSTTCPGPCGACEGSRVCLDDGSCYQPQCGSQTCGTDPKGFSCGTCAPGTTCVAGIHQCLPLPMPCLAGEGQGCGGCGCEACVCGKYPTCCTLHWDAFCAAACDQECGFDCTGCPANPSCSGIECGDFCGLKCGECGDGQVCRESKCCTRTCAGKTCGSDGCGGACGSCTGSDECTAGVCVPCQPECNGKSCGDDGCGGTCGACVDPQVCATNGTCVDSLCSPQCDGTGIGGACYCDDACFGYADCCPGLCSVCPGMKGCCVASCNGAVCGDDGCGGSCGACAAGTRCDAGQCAPCTADCNGKQCGDDNCNGSCGSCPGNQACDAGQCVACVAQCNGAPCGDDGCGGSCGTCPEALVCIASACVADPCKGFSYAGCCDGQTIKYCDPNNPSIVTADCQQSGPSCGWNAANGYYDCNTDGKPEPTGQFPVTCPACKIDCTGKTCGDDGCGGTCGTCDQGVVCLDHVCQPDQCHGVPASGCCDGPVVRYCADNQASSLDCSTQPSCGWNPQGYYACGTDGKADPSGGLTMPCPTCSPICVDRQCGPDGCGGACGVCGPGTKCNGGQCVADTCAGVPFEGCCAGELLRWCSHGTIQTADCAATPACGWKADAAMYDCGSDGSEDPSGIHPGTCPACTANCADRVCGDDGCGGSCGACAGGKACLGGQCACTAKAGTGCCGDAVCWLDSCGAAEDRIADCPSGCAGSTCTGCTPQCDGRGCGSDGCGGFCGTCSDGLECRYGTCAMPVVDTAEVTDPGTDATGEAGGGTPGDSGGGCQSGARGGAGAWAMVLLAMVGLALRRPRPAATLLAACAALATAASCGDPAGDDGGMQADATGDLATPTDPGPEGWDAEAPALDGPVEVEGVGEIAAEAVVDTVFEDVMDPGPGDGPAPDGGPEAVETAEESAPEPVEEAAPDVGDAPEITDAAVDDPTQEVPPAFDCANLPQGPFQLVKVAGAVASEDLAFDADGNLVGSDMTALFKTGAGKKAKLWIPDVQTRAGMRFAPNGVLYVNDDTLGRVIAFDPDGGMRVLVTGLSYPNGMAVDLQGFIYVTENDAGRVLRIHPYTGEYTVLTTKIQNPNGIVFNPDFTALYIGSFASGYVYKMSISADGVPGKLVEWVSPIGPGGLLDGMGVDACGNLYVCEYGGTDVYRIPPTGGAAVKIAHGDSTYLPNLQWGVGNGWDPYSLYLPDGWAVGLWRLEIGVPAAPRPFP